MTARTLREISGDTTALWSALVLCAVAILALVYAPATSEDSPNDRNLGGPTPAWLPPAATREQWRTEQRELFAMSRPAEADEATFVAAFVALGEAEILAPVNGSNEALRRAQTEAERAAALFVGQHGVSAFRALGFRLWAELFRAYSALAAEVRRGEAQLPVGDVGLLAAGSLGRTVQRLGGRIVDEALRLRLIDARGKESAGGRLVLELGFEVRWMLLAREVLALENHPNPSRIGALAAWRAEAHPTLPLERRVALAHEAARLWDTYPLDRALGNIYYAAGQRAEACEAWSRAAKQGAGDAEQADLLELLEQCGERP